MSDMEQIYQKDLINFCDHGDLGDEWCGEDVIQAMITWIKSNIEFDDPILSMGCGNASFLVQLHHLGYANLTGIDASSTAIKLATENCHQETAKINLEVGDVLDPKSCEKNTCLSPDRKYKLLLDKGMFDAISSSQTANMKEIREKYLVNTRRLLRDDGVLLLATCNHTEMELENQIGKGYTVLSVIPTPVLEFGGKKGHNITVVAFGKSR